MFCTRFATALLLALFTLHSNVHAGFFHNTSGLGSPTSTVTFSEVAMADNALVSNEFSAYGVEFPGQPIFEDSVTGNNVGGAGLRRVPLDSDGSAPMVFFIQFTETLTEAAFAMVTGDAIGPASALDNKFEALLGGAVQETGYVQSVAGRTDNFYGFTGVHLDAIRVTVASGYGGIGVLDNIQLGEGYDSVGSPVPEPGTAAVWTVLCGLGIAAVRRRRSRD